MTQILVVEPSVKKTPKKNGEGSTQIEPFDQDKLDQIMLSLCEGGSEASSSHILEAVAYHISSGGSRVRARLAFETSRVLSIDVEDAYALAACCELIHNASLIHDDIQDQDPSRRGQESVWSKYGIDQAICIGDLFLSSAYNALSLLDGRKMPLGDLIRITHSAISDVIQGQAHDLTFKRNKDLCIDEYEVIVRGKSAALLSLPVVLPLTATRKSDLVTLAHNAAAHFGIGYQMIDDLKDIQNDSAVEGSCLNAVSILMNSKSFSQSEAFNEVTALASQHLEKATHLSAHMPNNIGAPLSAFVTQYKSHLAKN